MLELFKKGGGQAEAWKDQKDFERKKSIVRLLGNEYDEEDESETDAALTDLLKLSYTNLKTEASPKRELSNANALYKAFLPVQSFAVIFGRFPLRAMLQPDGTRHYQAMNHSFNTIYFVVTTILVTVLMTFGSIGFVLLLTLSDDLPSDFCGKSWIDVKLSQLVVPVAVSWSWIVLTFFGSIHMFLYGLDYAHYLNYWKRCVQVLDMDVCSNKAKWVGLKEALTVTCLCVIYFGLYFSYRVDVMIDSAAVITHAVIRMFKYDLYRDTLPLVSDNTTKVYCGEWKPYHLWSFMGFVIQMYGLCASRCFMLQFRFFCRTLNQASETWCSRFQNTMNHTEPDPKDERMRRMTCKELLKDHLIIVQLFKLTEVTFGVMLLSYYIIVIFNFCFEAFYIYSGITYNSCYMVGFLYDEIMRNCPKGKVPNNNSYYVQLKRHSAPNFDGCYPDYIHSGAVNTGIAIFFLAQTLSSFLDVTLDAANASEKAMHGFSILRRSGFMYCANRKERNFVHSLAVSYAYFRPMHIAARGYFPVTRSLVVQVLLVVITWFVVMLQLRDLSEIYLTPDALCTDKNSPAAAITQT